MAAEEAAAAAAATDTAADAGCIIFRRILSLCQFCQGAVRGAEPVRRSLTFDYYCYGATPKIHCFLFGLSLVHCILDGVTVSLPHPPVISSSAV